MKILFVAPLNVSFHDNSLNSVMINIALFARGLQRSGDQVAVACLDGSASRAVPVIPLPGCPEPNIYANRPIQRSKTKGLGAATAAAAYINEHRSEWDAILIKGMERSLYEPHIARMPNVFYFPSVCDMPPSLDRKVRQVARKTGKRTVFLTEFQRRHFNAIDGRHAIVPCPFDVRRTLFGAIPNGNPLWAARILPHKGLHHALQLAQWGALTLDVAGPIEDQSYFETLRTRFKNLNYLGPLAPRTLWQRMASAPFLLQTQQWNEAFGRTTVEAGLCGTPVIAVDRGANAELIQPHRTGLMLDSMTCKAFRTCARAAADLDRRAIRKTLCRRFSSQRVTQQLRQALVTTL